MTLVPTGYQKCFLIWGSLEGSLYGATFSLCCLGETKVCRIKKAIYGLKQSPWAWFEKFSFTISGISFHRCHSDYSVFVRRTKYGVVVLAIYVDDILLIDSDSVGSLETKMYLKHHFVTKDMRHPKYFLGIEVARQKQSVLLSQRKYALDLFEEAGLLGCKPANTLIEANVNLWFNDSHILGHKMTLKILHGL